MKNTSSVYLSAGKIAKLLGVSRGKVLRWIHQGKMKAHRLPGGQFRVSLRDLREFCVEHDLPVPVLADRSLFPDLPSYLRCERCIFDDPPRPFMGACLECDVFRTKTTEIASLLDNYTFPAAAAKADVLLAVNRVWRELLPGMGPGTPLELLAGEEAPLESGFFPEGESSAMRRLSAANPLQAAGVRTLKCFPCGLGGVRCSLVVPGEH